MLTTLLFTILGEGAPAPAAAPGRGAPGRGAPTGAGAPGGPGRGAPAGAGAPGRGAPGGPGRGAPGGPAGPGRGGPGGPGGPGRGGPGGPGGPGRGAPGPGRGAPGGPGRGAPGPGGRGAPGGEFPLRPSSSHHFQKVQLAQPFSLQAHLREAGEVPLALAEERLLVVGVPQLVVVRFRARGAKNGTHMMIPYRSQVHPLLRHLHQSCPPFQWWVAAVHCMTTAPRSQTN